MLPLLAAGGHGAHRRHVPDGRRGGGLRALRRGRQARQGRAARPDRTPVTAGRLHLAVVGGSEADDATCDLAEEVGGAVARRGAVLVCGGLGGVMEAACRGAQAGGGTTVGILPGSDRPRRQPVRRHRRADRHGRGRGTWSSCCAPTPWWRSAASSGRSRRSRWPCANGKPGGRPRHLGAAPPRSPGRRDRPRDQPGAGRRPGPRPGRSRPRRPRLITTTGGTLDYGRADGRGRRAHRPAPAEPSAAQRRLETPRRKRRSLIGAAIAGTVVVGVVLRFWTTSELWLDEALTVNVARLPLGDIPGRPASRREPAALLLPPPRLDPALRRGRPRGAIALRRVRCRRAAVVWLAGAARGPGQWRGRRRLPGHLAVRRSASAPRHGCTRSSPCSRCSATCALMSALESPSRLRLAGLAAVTGAAAADPLLGLLPRHRHRRRRSSCSPGGARRQRPARLALLAMGAGSCSSCPGCRSSSASCATRARPGPSPPPSRRWSTRSASSRAASATRAGPGGADLRARRARRVRPRRSTACASSSTSARGHAGAGWPS